MTLSITEQLATLYVKGYEAIYSESYTGGDTIRFTAYRAGNNINFLTDLIKQL